MTYKVLMKKRVAKRIEKLPQWVQEKVAVLLLDLRQTGPSQNHWQNFSKLGETQYHCHLGSSWAACWKMEKKTIEIEVYYVGSREDAPYG